MVINKRVIAGAIVIAIAIVVYGILTLNGIAYQKTTTNQATAFLTVIPPESIPTQDLSLLSSTPTPTQNTNLGELKGIQINLYVQISGTSGVGLNIRNEPGLAGEKHFLANESEVFLVVDGPISQDNLIWWKLKAPYDQQRQGWAAADYLGLIEGQ
ncbi:MAG: hypothetical protein AB9897_09135 [Anaerolineaceae bacterium]